MRAGIPLVASTAAWFALDSFGLALFALLVPVLWLFGANYALTSARMPGLLDGLCRTAPRIARMGLAGPGAMA